MAPPKFPQTSTRSSISAYPPPPSLSSLIKSTSFWGGEDFIARLKCYVHILRSNLRRFCFFPIVICQLAFSIPCTWQTSASKLSSSICTISQSLFASLLCPTSFSRSDVFKRPTVLPNPDGSATVLRGRHVMQLRIFAHLLAKLIVTHSPESVKSLVDGNGDIDWGNWEEMGGDGRRLESLRVQCFIWHAGHRLWQKKENRRGGITVCFKSSLSNHVKGSNTSREMLDWRVQYTWPSESEA
ncbi:hypothetical protein F5880DRAFT_1679102 [Lentinula raphanica]|nr:hypothetical protein F5880DRAFT_1679102 [Lentinula raphanica]